MVARCGTSIPCDSTLFFVSANGIEPLLIVVWAITAVLAIARPLARGLSPWPVVGIGAGASILFTGLAYLMLLIAVRLL
ncbi:hypothetical protein B0I08_103305 [Glaciihabitans tibetensis]|uniref:Uncharacterized protein n=2 Tax=Glaciihabitans tibetensis TaxID=1266600 RepID=A0A2T0VFW1_9MICO|nr:hypothetical protein B0I08_103305 [Glaciihabitans tibetensis]